MRRAPAVLMQPERCLHCSLLPRLLQGSCSLQVKAVCETLRDNFQADSRK